MKLLGRADSLNVRKVLWAIDEMGIDIPREDYGGSFGKTDSPEYRRWNPPALVPTLIDGETAVWESNTIIRYLGSKNPDNGFSVTAPRPLRARRSGWIGNSARSIHSCRRYSRNPDSAISGTRKYSTKIRKPSRSTSIQFWRIA